MIFRKASSSSSSRLPDRGISITPSNNISTSILLHLSAYKRTFVRCQKFQSENAIRSFVITIRKLRESLSRERANGTQHQNWTFNVHLTDFYGDFTSGFVLFTFFARAFHQFFNHIHNKKNHPKPDQCLSHDFLFLLFLSRSNPRAFFLLKKKEKKTETRSFFALNPLRHIYDDDAWFIVECIISKRTN